MSVTIANATANCKERSRDFVEFVYPLLYNPVMALFDRRNFLRYSGLGIFYTLFSRKADAATFFMKRYLALPPKETPFYTPNQDFYIVNYSRPRQIAAEAWFLGIVGLVKRPLTLSYKDILALPSVERVVTLECIDNEVAGDLIGNALWRGIPLKVLLEEVGPEPGVEEIIMYAGDDYSESITLDRALHYDVMLAYEMNGEPLPEVHGYPLRAVVPGLYGIKNVKWLTRMELVNYDYKGYWQQRGWTDEGHIKVTSRIDSPGPYNTIKEKSYTIRGIAFAGYGGVGRVEVSTNGGKDWLKADLDAVPSLYCWVPWSYRWNPPAPGSYEIQARAADKFGRQQSALIARAFPEGTSGYHSVIAFSEQE
jgi:DMSO/TMAO reductase YedYZ molybdopterin-dependent catalytic subunit